MSTAEEDADADQVRRIPDFKVFPGGVVVAWPRPRNPEHRRQLEECIDRLELETPEAPQVHCTYADKQIYIHLDVSGQWPADTLLVQPLPANMSDPSHLSFA
jgi:hypothetical protein